MANTVVAGDSVCCETDKVQKPWMIGLTVTSVVTHDGPDQNTWMGRITAGELEGSGMVFGETEKRVPIFVEDIRLVKFNMKKLETRISVRSARVDKRVFDRYELGKDDKAKILVAMPLDLDRATRHSSRKAPE